MCRFLNTMGVKCFYATCVLLWKLPINVGKEENIFCQEVDEVKNKNLEDFTMESCRQTPDV